MSRKIGFVLTILFSFILIGLLEFVSCGFSLEYLTTFEFWFKLTTCTFANFLILYTTADKDITDSYEKNEEICKTENSLKSIIKTSVYPDFDDYLSELNRKRKADAWKDKISRKISKLDKKANLKDNETLWYGTEEQKSENLYCKKRKQLEYKMSDEYINKHILFIHIKYNKLKKYVILTGCDQRADDYKLTTNQGWRIIKDNKYRIFMSMVITLTLASLIPDLKTFTWVALIIFGFKLLVLLYNFISGKQYAIHYQRNIILPDFKYREDIIIDYLKWKKIKRSDVNETISM